MSQTPFSYNTFGVIMCHLSGGGADMTRHWRISKKGVGSGIELGCFFGFSLLFFASFSNTSLGTMTLWKKPTPPNQPTQKTARLVGGVGPAGADA